MQVEGLARLDGKLGAAAVPQGQTVRALRGERQVVNAPGTRRCHSFTHYRNIVIENFSPMQVMVHPEKCAYATFFPQQLDQS